MAGPMGDVMAQMAVVVVGVFGIMQLQYQQSFDFIIVPQILFIVRVLDISADMHSAKLCRGLCP